MSELYRIDDTPTRRRLKLWHLAALVAASALVFGIGRGLTGQEGRTTLTVIGIFLLFWGTLGVFFACLALGARLGERAALAIDDVGRRHGLVVRLAARSLAMVVYAIVFPGSAVAGLAALYAAIWGFAVIFGP